MNKKTFEEMAGTWLQISEIMLLTDKLEKVCKEQKPPMTVGGHVHAILKEKIEAKANADATTDSLMGAANSSTVPAARKSFRSELDIHKVANSQHIHLRRSSELPIFFLAFVALLQNKIESKSTLAMHADVCPNVYDGIISCRNCCKGTLI